MENDPASLKNKRILKKKSHDSVPTFDPAATLHPGAFPAGNENETEEPCRPACGEHAQESCHMRIVLALRRIMHFVDTHSRKLSMDYHITLPQLICLHTIVNDGPMTLSALGKLVSLSMSTVNGIIDRLEVKKLVERKRSDPDRRKVLITATHEGVALTVEVPLPLQNKLVQAISELPELERVSIALSLERIADMMEDKQHSECSRK